MKKAAVIALLAMAIGIIMSSCSREVCPAMSEVQQDNTEVVNA